MKWSDYFIFDEKTGNLLNKFTRNNRAKAGDVSGYVNDSGYVVVRIDGKRFRAHRVIWEMHHGEIPNGYEIDHINRVRGDNKLENLRLVTSHENNLNLSKRKSISGVTGVVFNKKDGKWQAQIGFNGKHVYLGQFLNKSDAIKARNEAEIKYGFRR